ncbi:MAG TPA: hypothetical protein VLE97_06445 [Gaiellaceae bacterium]|nr:hypothetical protein [Gaiellaceae bacterium]
MSEVYTPEAWQKECADAATGELLHWNAVYVGGNPLGWTDDQIKILRDEIERRRPT